MNQGHERDVELSKVNSPVPAKADPSEKGLPHPAGTAAGAGAGAVAGGLIGALGEPAGAFMGAVAGSIGGGNSAAGVEDADASRSQEKTSPQPAAPDGPNTARVSADDPDRSPPRDAYDTGGFSSAGQRQVLSADRH